MNDSSWIEEHYDRIHRAAWMMTGCAAEAQDLAQETFIVAVDRWESFQHRSRVETWLYGILLRIKSRRDRSLNRFAKRLRSFVSDRPERCVDDPTMATLRSEWRNSIWSEVAKLPPHQRDAVVLRFGQELSIEKVAEALQCPIGTVKTRLHHAMKRLSQSRELKQAHEENPLEIPSPKLLDVAPLESCVR